MQVPVWRVDEKIFWAQTFPPKYISFVKSVNHCFIHLIDPLFRLCVDFFVVFLFYFSKDNCAYAWKFDTPSTGYSILFMKGYLKSMSNAF